ncbi:hypothetical protein O9992_16425 [Vibrio lentus]|nr:hypothetical protein [Vibrio lentus]
MDKDGNMDVTTSVTDLLPTCRYDRNDNDDEERQKLRLKLMRHNIPTNAGLAKFIGTGLKGVDKVIGEDEFDVEDGAPLYAEQRLTHRLLHLPYQGCV